MNVGERQISGYCQAMWDIYVAEPESSGNRTTEELSALLARFITMMYGVMVMAATFGTQEENDVISGFREDALTKLKSIDEFAWHRIRAGYV